MERYGYEPIVTKLGRKLLDALIRGGYVFTQQFDPFTGEPSRVGMVSHEVLSRDSDEPFQDSYGPTLLAALEYIAHIWGLRWSATKCGSAWVRGCPIPMRSGSGMMCTK